MKLKKFDLESYPPLNGRVQKKTISINYKGHIMISQAAKEMMALKDGDSIAILHDEDEPENWYIAKDPKGIKLRNKNATSLLGQSTPICRAVLKEMGFTAEHNYHFPIAVKPTIVNKTQYWGILTIAATWRGKI